MRINYSTIVQPDTFIGRYMKAFSNSETATAYDFWCAMWLLSIGCSRFIYVDRPNAHVYMNWYIVLLAESGVTRKSTAIRRATRAAIKFIQLSGDHMEVIENGITPSALEERLAANTSKHGYAHTILSSSELIRVLGKDNHTKSMPGLLTDLYDCPSSRHGGGTVSRGNRTYTNVFMSLLGASTPSWLASAINPDVIEGGFTSRCLFINSEQRKKKIAWPVVDDNTQWKQYTIETLLHVREQCKVHKVLSIDSAAKDTFINWYNRREESHEAYTRSFESREDDHILRMAGLLSINRDEYTITRADIKCAIRVIGYVKSEAANLFTKTPVDDKLMRGIERVRQCIIESKDTGIPHTALYRKVQHLLNSTELNTLISIMHESLLIKKYSETAVAQGRSKYIYRATNNLMNPQSIYTILHDMD